MGDALFWLGERMNTDRLPVRALHTRVYKETEVPRVKATERVD